ncbi:MAG TPA: IS21-like element helper ATPase IstB [Candidatus Krumholzibacteria bacterium]|nr:IS21-like element helper ATPase IstB [Candidatus Krumholzibacteria bacterium]
MNPAPIDTRLRRLRLAYMAQSVEAQNAESLRQKHSYLEFLEALVVGELAARENKALTKRIKTARFPVPKTLEEFDFDFQPKLDVKLIKSLATCDFVERKENVIFVGQPGTGKSHLSVALAMKACEAGYRVRFTTVQDLAATLRASMADHTTEARIADFVEPDLIILDELGFTPLDRLLADAFYRIVASRYERASTLITSNKSFESWAEVFPDAVIASAVLDRLVHHAHLVPIVGESYRMKDLKTRKKGGGKAVAA